MELNYITEYICSLPSGKPYYVINNRYVINLEKPDRYAFPSTFEKWFVDFEDYLKKTIGKRTDMEMGEFSSVKAGKLPETDVNTGLVLLTDEERVDIMDYRGRNIVFINGVNCDEQSTERKYLKCDNCSFELHSCQKAGLELEDNYDLILSEYIWVYTGCWDSSNISKPILCQACYDKKPRKEQMNFSPVKSTYACIETDYGSMYDWIPIAWDHKAGYDNYVKEPVIVYVNMNPDSEKFGLVSTSTMDEDGFEEFNISSINITEFEKDQIEEKLYLRRLYDTVNPFETPIELHTPPIIKMTSKSGGKLYFKDKKLENIDYNYPSKGPIMKICSYCEIL